MKKAKVSKHSTSISEGAKICGSLNDGFSWRQKPICDAALEKLADDLVQWAKTTDEIDIEAFFDEKDLYIEHAYDWMKRNACFKEAYELALQKLGTRRSRGAARFALKDSWIRAMQYRYHKAWASAEERAAKLKTTTEEEQDKKITVKVIRE